MALNRAQLDEAERADNLARELVSLAMKEDLVELAMRSLDMHKEPRIAAITATRLAGLCVSLIEGMAAGVDLTPQELWSRLAVEGAEIMQRQLQKRRDAL